MNLIYMNNKKLLKQKSLQLYQQIFDDKAYSATVKIKDDLHGNTILTDSINEIYLHSVYSVDRENQKMFEHVPKDTEVLIFFGIGKGFGLDYAKRHFDSLKRVIIIEPNQEVFKAFLCTYDLNSILNGLGEITFILNQNQENVIYQLSHLLFSLMQVKFEILYLMSYKHLYKDYFSDINKQVVDLVRGGIVNLATINAFKYLWISNIFRNLKKHAIMSTTLENFLKGKTVFIVSAGPSLNKNIQLIKEIGDKGIVVAVGSAIKILDSHGIRPHFRFSIDGSPGQMKIFKDLKIQNVPLLSSYMHAYEVQESYQGEVVRVVLDGDFFVHYILDKAQINYNVFEVGYSVANVALNFFCQNAVDRIVFLGQDLAFTDGEHYAQGSWDNEKKDLDNPNFIKIKDIYGNDTYTDKTHYSMKILMEKAILRYGDSISFIDATEGGAKIEHTEIMPLKFVLEELLDKDTPHQALSSFFAELPTKRLKWDLDKPLMEIRVENREFLQKTYHLIDLLDNLKSKKVKSIQKDKFFVKAIEDLSSSLYYKSVVSKYLVAEAIKCSSKMKDIKSRHLEQEYNAYHELASDYNKFALVVESLLAEYFGEQKFEIIVEK